MTWDGLGVLFNTSFSTADVVPAEQLAVFCHIPLPAGVRKEDRARRESRSPGQPSCELFVFGCSTAYEWLRTPPEKKSSRRNTVSVGLLIQEVRYSSFIRSDLAPFSRFGQTFPVSLRSLLLLGCRRQARFFSRSLGFVRLSYPRCIAVKR